MAYRKQKQRILSGSVNLLPPGDLTPDPDSLDLRNFRVDQAGQLRSRRGMILDGAPGVVHSLHRTGNDRYGGVGTTLVTGASLGTAVASGFDGQPLSFASMLDYTWVMNRGKRVKVEGANATNWGIAAPTSAPAAVAGAANAVLLDEFDVLDWDAVYWSNNVGTFNPVFDTVITQQGQVQCVNGSVEVTGINTNWNSGMDGASIQIVNSYNGGSGSVYTVIAAVADNTHLSLITGFDGDDGTYDYVISTQQVAREQDGTNKQSGTGSLHVIANPPGRWQIRKTFTSPLDLRPGGEDRDEDRLRLWLYASDPAAVTAIKVILFDGDRLLNATNAVEATVAPSTLNPASYTWNRLEIARRANPYAAMDADEDYSRLSRDLAEAERNGDQARVDLLNQYRHVYLAEAFARKPHFRGVGLPVGAIAEFDWSKVTEAWIEVEVTSPCDLHFDRAEMVGGSEGGMSGEFSFAYTFANDDGHESNGSDFSEGLVLQQQVATLSGIGISPDPQVKRRHVYAIGGALNEALRVATIEDNATTTLDLSIDFDAAQNRYTKMPIDHDLPPAASGVAGPYGGRLVAWDGIRMYWTPVAKPYAWPGADDPSLGNWRDVGEAGDDILAVRQGARMLRIYKQRSIWRHVGDIDRGVPELANPARGLVGRQAICSDGQMDYYASEEGIYRSTGDSDERISAKLDPIFKGESVPIADGVTIPHWERSAAHACTMAVAQGRLYFSYPEAGRSAPNVTLVYDIETGRWARDSRGFTALYYEGVGNGLVGGLAGGGVYLLEQGATDASSAIPVVWQGRFSDQGIPDNEKVYADLVVVHRTAEAGETPSSLTVKMVYDNGTVESIGSISSGKRSRSVFRLGADGRGRRGLNAAVRIEGDCRSTVTIFGVWLHWYAEQRTGKTFDTGVIDLGPYAHDVGEIEFDTTGSGTVNWRLDTDIPGAAIAQRASGTVTAGARGTALAQIPAGVLGRRVRLTAWSDSEAAIHGARLKVRQIGAYVDGAAGQFWESVPL